MTISLLSDQRLGHCSVGVYYLAAVGVPAMPALVLLKPVFELSIKLPEVLHLCELLSSDVILLANLLFQMLNVDC